MLCLASAHGVPTLLGESRIGAVPFERRLQNVFADSLVAMGTPAARLIKEIGAVALFRSTN